MDENCSMSTTKRHEWRTSIHTYCTCCGLIHAPGNPFRKRKPKSSPDREKARRALLATGESKCFYCLVELQESAITLDHFIPRSKGGPNRTSNLRICCNQCNRDKGDKMPWEFMPDRFSADE